MKQSATLDSSFWINACRSGLLEAVLQLFELHFAAQVGTELSEQFACGREFWRLVQEGRIVRAETTVRAFTSHGPGEQAAINLALTHPDWVLLMDDRRPLSAAQMLGVRTVCTPVFIVNLYVQGIIDAAEALRALARLAALKTVSPILMRSGLEQLALAMAERG